MQLGSERFRAWTCTAALTVAMTSVPFPGAGAAELGFANGVDPVAFGIPTAEIFVDGPFGGEIDWNNTGVDQPFPDGACGFRVDGVNLLEWGWYDGGVYGDTFMNIENNGEELPGEPGAWIEFTGPYGPGCEDEYVFHTPATPFGEPPFGAVRMVIQFLDWHDIEFLDSGFQVIEPEPDPWGPDPEPVDPCEIAPEFCEGPTDDFQLDLGCLPLWNMGLPCDPEGEDAELGAFAGYAATWNVQLATSALARTANTVDPGILDTIRIAGEWLGAAKAAHEALVREVGHRELSAEEARFLARLTTAMDQGAKKLADCESAAKRASIFVFPRLLDRATSECRSAAAQLFDGHEAAAAYARLRVDDAK